MSTLFEETIADAKKLKMLAEENAKNKILDTMTPKIRALIEQELMDVEGEIDIDEYIPPAPEDVLELEPEDANPTQVVNIAIDGEANIGVSAGEMDVEEEAVGDDELLVGLNAESARALASVIRNPSALNPKNTLSKSLTLLETKLQRFKKLIRYVGTIDANSTLRETVRKYYTQFLKEMISLRQDIILTEGKANANGLRSEYNRIVKEMKTMSKRHAETLFDRLFEEQDKKQEGQYETDEKDIKGDIDEFDVIFDEEELTDLGIEDPDAIGGLSADVSVEAGAEEEEVVEAYLRELFEQDEEEIDVEEEVEEEGPIEDVGEVIPVADAESALEDLGAALGLDISVGAEEEEEIEVGEEEEEVLEIDESVLRRELRRMRHLREQDGDPYVDHGGEELGDVIVDVDEEDLINALEDELGPAEVLTPTVESRIRRRLRRAPRRSVAEARRRPRRTAPPRRDNTRTNESRRSRALTKKLVEYRSAVGTLKNQLTEMNLFNAKLLYVNKLMQNRNLTTKHQRAIVEALDNAKTLREAKLLYKSLTASLNKRGGGRSLTEGRNARTLGSSSRSIRSASATKNGNEVDRWAVLAGINKD
jgi:hypothetical protein